MKDVELDCGRREGKRQRLTRAGTQYKTIFTDGRSRVLADCMFPPTARTHKVVWIGRWG